MMAAVRTAVRKNYDVATDYYVYGVALQSTGKRREALRVLEASPRRHPADRDTLLALATIHRDAGARAEALEFARKLSRLLPADPGIRQLIQQLEGS
jgi:Flp pilus assembly protein TadD